MAGAGKKTLRKINRFVKDIQRNPFEGMRHPDPLSGNLSGQQSRHIDEKTALYINLQEEIQRFFHVKIIMEISDIEWEAKKFISFFVETYI